VECDAVEALLDEEYEIDGFSYGKAPGDPNANTTGRVGNHHVMLAYMPRVGKASSTAVASTILTSFEGIKVGLVVGICGGAPITADGAEILLGDVIISEIVIQIDFGGRYPDKSIRKDTPEDNLGRANSVFP
jgi:nucleoside phosphorylase